VKRSVYDPLLIVRVFSREIAKITETPLSITLQGPVFRLLKSYLPYGERALVLETPFIDGTPWEIRTTLSAVRFDVDTAEVVDAHPWIAPQQFRIEGSPRGFKEITWDPALHRARSLRESLREAKKRGKILQLRAVQGNPIAEPIVVNGRPTNAIDVTGAELSAVEVVANHVAVFFSAKPSELLTRMLANGADRFTIVLANENEPDLWRTRWFVSAVEQKTGHIVLETEAQQ
jgi:hypothetical protein